MPIEERFCTTRYGRLRGLANGPAPTIVLVHGSGGDADVWRPVLERLGRVAAIAIDMPGHGGSDPRLLDSVVESARCLDALREALGAPRLLVVGQSLGGAIAQQYGHDFADRCAGILVANSAPDFAVTPERFRAIAEDWTKTAEGYAAGQVSPRASPALREAARQMIARRDPAVFAADLALCNGFSSRAWAAELRVPVLILAGHDDVMTVPARSHAILELIPHAELIELSPCGHCTMLEQPARFAAEIEAFAARV